jgi:hypothetical protein
MNKLTLLAAVSTLALHTVAHAAYLYTPPVTVSTSSYGNSAYGSIQGSYYAPDRYEYIGCEAGSGASNYSYVFCAAENSAGSAVYCAVVDPPEAMIQSVASINGQSYVAFAENPTTGQCTYIDVTDGSPYT